VSERYSVLTEKRRSALETAFRAGYFDWPRTTNGAEIAGLLDIIQATFSEHFRAAEWGFFTAVLENGKPETVSLEAVRIERKQRLNHCSRVLRFDGIAQLPSWPVARESSGAATHAVDVRNPKTALHHRRSSRER